MIKGSHNTFTYGKPQWYLRPFAFIARCQNKPLYEQYKSGVRCFDLRLRKNKDGDWIIPHNSFIYATSFDLIGVILDYLNRQAKDNKEDIWVRVLHEVRNNNQAKYSKKEDFEYICKTLEEKFPHLKFFGGQQTMDWRQDYSFNNNIQYIEKHASVCWKKPWRWFPWLYAFFNNKKILNDKTIQEDNNTVLFYDFV